MPDALALRNRRVEVVLRQQDLCDLVPVRGEQPVVHVDQLALADRRRRLLLLCGKPLAYQSDLRQSAAYRTRRNKHARLAAVLNICHTAHQPLGFAEVHQPAGIGESGGADLDDDALPVIHIQLHYM